MDGVTQGRPGVPEAIRCPRMLIYGLYRPNSDASSGIRQRPSSWQAAFPAPRLPITVPRPREISLAYLRWGPTNPPLAGGWIEGLVHSTEGAKLF
jgi:hypothetical protein